MMLSLRKREKGEVPMQELLSKMRRVSVDLPVFNDAAVTSFILELEAFFNILYEIFLRRELRTNSDHS